MRGRRCENAEFMGRPIIKTADEIRAMRAAGRIASKVLRGAAMMAAPGLTTRELDVEVGRLIASHGAASAFLGYRGFPGQCCLSVNEAVIHGIGDVAMTMIVGGGSLKFQKLLDTTVQSLYEGISAAQSGARVVDIGRAVERCVVSSGYGVVREFCGHGVGRNVHEEPQVPNYVDLKSVTRLKSGMTIAIEPMVTMGSAAVEILDDGWTVVTRDRQVSAHFEHTVLITDSGPEILTRDEESHLY